MRVIFISSMVVPLVVLVFIILRGDAGMTALMCAVMKGHVECAEILVRHGASMSTKALNGASASSMLKRKKNIEMSRRLKVISEELTKSAATEAERKRREASEEDEQRAKQLQIRCAV
jgi:ankyrin repeat protein